MFFYRFWRILGIPKVCSKDSSEFLEDSLAFKAKFMVFFSFDQGFLGCCKVLFRILRGSEGSCEVDPEKIRRLEV